jgi:hypothetical protein
MYHVRYELSIRPRHQGVFLIRLQMTTADFDAPETISCSLWVWHVLDEHMCPAALVKHSHPVRTTKIVHSDGVPLLCRDRLRGNRTVVTRCRIQTIARLRR